MSGTKRTGVIRTRDRKDGVNLRVAPQGEIVGGLAEETPVEILSTKMVDGHLWYEVKQQNGPLKGFVFENVYENAPSVPAPAPSPSPAPKPAPKVKKLKVIGGIKHENKDGTWLKAFPVEKQSDLGADLKEFVPAKSEYQVEVLGEEKSHYRIKLVGAAIRGKTEWYVYKFHVEVK